MLCNIVSGKQFTLTRLAEEVIACAAGSFKGELIFNYGISVRRANVFQPTGRWMRLSKRCLSLTALLAVSIAILNLLPRGAFAGEEPTRDVDTPKKPKAERPAFDLTYVPATATSVIAIRPSAIFSDPAMRPLAVIADQGLVQLRQYLKLSGKPKLSVEDIEEIIGNITIVPGDKRKGGTFACGAGFTMIRATHDFDWLTLMRQLDPKTEEIRHEDRVYYRSHLAKLFGGTSGLPPTATFCFFMPDKRTVAFLQEKTLSAFVNGQDIQRPQFSWDKDWKRVEHGLIAVATDNRWMHKLSKEQIGCDPAWTSLAQNVDTMIAGVDWNDRIDLQAFLVCNDGASARQAKGIVRDMLEKMRSEIDPAERYDEFATETSEEEPLWQDLMKLMKQTHVARRGDTVSVHTIAKINIADLLTNLLSASSETESKTAKPK